MKAFLNVYVVCREADFQNYYFLPIYFSSDWLNEFSDFRTDTQDDFRFVYIGPQGTWTPLHTDVYCSYSWSANIVGRKRWWIFPPGMNVSLLASSFELFLPWTISSLTKILDGLMLFRGKDKGRALLRQSGYQLFYLIGHIYFVVTLCWDQNSECYAITISF